MNKTENKTEDMVAYKKNYYLEHRAHLLQLMLKEVECECGFKTGKCNFARHQKTKLHQKKLRAKDL